MRKQSSFAAFLLYRSHSFPAVPPLKKLLEKKEERRERTIDEIRVEAIHRVEYLVILLFIGIITYNKLQSDTRFHLGNRSLNYWLTALAAHASDMSSWLFLAYPASIYTQRVCRRLDRHWSDHRHVSQLAVRRAQDPRRNGTVQQHDVLVFLRKPSGRPRRV